MTNVKKIIGILLTFCLLLTTVPSGIVFANEDASIRIEITDSEGVVSQVSIGDFIDATIYIDNAEISVMTLPIFFDSSVVEVWYTNSSQKVADGNKNVQELTDGETGITLGQAFEISPNWGGKFIYNDYAYPYINNTDGLIKTSAYSTDFMPITTEQSVISIHFKVVGVGNPDIRFAINTDPSYDVTAPLGADLRYADSKVSYVEDIPTIEALNNKVLIEFDVDGGSTISPINVVVGDEITQPITTKVGYSVGGWYEEDTFTNIITFPYTVAAAMTMYAEWVVDDYQAIYNDNEATNGTVPLDATVYHIDNSVTIIGNINGLERNGYNFIGWTLSLDELAHVYVAGDSVTFGGSNVNFYAKWEFVDYTVTYDGNTEDSGSIPNDATIYHISDSVTVLGNPNNLVKDEYDFTGWSVDSDGSGQIFSEDDTFAMGDNDVTLYAIWDFKEHTVEYNQNGADLGTIPVDNGVYVAGEIATVMTNEGNLSKEGYTFDGWNTKADGNGITYQANTDYTMGTVDANLYVLWKAIDYQVIYNSTEENSGYVPVDATVYHIGNTVTITGNSNGLEKVGYIFKGWTITLDELATVYIADDTMTMGSTTINLYAKWDIAPFTIDFNVDGGSFVTSITQNYHTTINVAPTTAKDGHTFEGWFEENTFNTSITFPYTIEDDATIFAKFTPVDYFISYQGNGFDTGTVPTDDTIYHIGDKVIVKDNVGMLTKTGYSFVGWNSVADGSGTSYVAASEMPVNISDITLYAIWNINNFTINFDTKGGSAVSSISRDYGSIISTKPSSSKSGYNFAGWYSDSSYSSEATFPMTVTSSATLYAKWNVIYTASVGGSGMGAAEVLTTRMNTYITNRDIQQIIANGEKRIIDVSVTSPVVRDFIVIIKGETIRAFYENGFDLLISTGFMDYTVTFTKDDMVTWLEAHGLTLMDLDNLDFEIEVEQLKGDEKALIESKLGENIIEVSSPISYTIKIKERYVYNKDGIGEMKTFKAFNVRLIKLPDGYTKESNLTGVVVNSDGSLSPVPTTIVDIDGKLYIRMLSLSNSTYMVVENTVEVPSVANHWSKAIVNELAAKLVISNPSGFVPNQIITRGEFADYITKALGIYRTGIATKLFSDVAITDKYADAITAAVEFGIINGYPDGTFKTNNKISREEAMLMFARAMDVISLDEIDNHRIDGYIDKTSVSSWAYDGVKKTLSVGVFNGRTLETIVPKGTFTHAEAATAIHNLLIASALY